MKNNFEKELENMMKEEKEIPAKVRQSLDQSYDMIRAKSKKKKARFVWKRVAAVASAILVTGIILTNEQVMAGINGFFNFGDKGIDRAVTEGFALEDQSTAADQGISITLARHFSDANKIGMSFQIIFDDPAVLQNAEDISMDYRLKNGDGEYIVEFIPDTKPLKGTNRHIAGLEDYNPILNIEAGKVQFDVVMDSHNGSIPALQDAVVEIESVDIFYGIDRELKKIDGRWDLPVNNKSVEDGPAIEYVMNDEASLLHVSSAKANPTSMNIVFSVDKISYDDENAIAHHMKIIDENGEEFVSNGGFSMDRNGDGVVISTNFPITSYNSSAKLKLVVEGIGEVELVKK
ncbi:DUF4179 domain-containing protein [Lysinibacillus odysseyi]|nr:DUF4179 domain-containing protein [Lysinibacillus odysseyi]